MKQLYIALLLVGTYSPLPLLSFLLSPAPCFKSRIPHFQRLDGLEGHSAWTYLE